MARRFFYLSMVRLKFPLHHTRRHRIVKQKYQQSQEYRLYQGHRLSQVRRASPASPPVESRSGG